MKILLYQKLIRSGIGLDLKVNYLLHFYDLNAGNGLKRLVLDSGPSQGWPAPMGELVRRRPLNGRLRKWAPHGALFCCFSACAHGSDPFVPYGCDGPASSHFNISKQILLVRIRHYCIDHDFGVVGFLLF